MNGSGLLRAFDGATGEVIWNVQLPNQRVFSAPPTVSDGVIYVSGAGSGGTVYAVNAGSGSILWTRQVANGDKSSPAVTRDGVYVSYTCPNVYKLDPATGTPIWQSLPVVREVVVKLPRCTTGARDVNTNSALWSFSGDGSLQSAVLAVNDYVYVGSAQGNLYAVNAATGQQVWVTNTGDSIPFVDEQSQQKERIRLSR